MSKIRSIVLTSSELAEYLQLRFNSPDDLEVVDCAWGRLGEETDVIVVQIRSEEFTDISDLTKQCLVSPPGKPNIILDGWKVG